MTNHLNHVPEEDHILKKICDQISARYFLYCEEQFPIWARLPDGEHAFEVTPQDKLFKYLDEESRAIGQSHGSNISNYVMFTRNGNIITVTHFGPFGEKKEEQKPFKDTLDKTDRFRELQGKVKKNTFNKKLTTREKERKLAHLERQEKQRQSKRGKGQENKRGLQAYEKSLIEEYWAPIPALVSRIDSKRKDVSQALKPKANIKEIERQLENLYQQLDEAEAQHEYAKEVLEEPGFGIETLEHKISVLEEIRSRRSSELVWLDDVQYEYQKEDLEAPLFGIENLEQNILVLEKIRSAMQGETEKVTSNVRASRREALGFDPSTGRLVLASMPASKRDLIIFTGGFFG